VVSIGSRTDGRTDALHMQRVLTLTERLNRMFTSEYVTVMADGANTDVTSGRTSAVHRVTGCLCLWKYCSCCTVCVCVQFIVTLSVAALRKRKHLSAGIFRDSYRIQGHHKADTPCSYSGTLQSRQLACSRGHQKWTSCRYSGTP
jgi:hypothetical protein